MSSYIKKRLQKLNAADDDVIRWARNNGYSSLEQNISFLRQMFVDAHDDEALEFPDLEMRGTRVTVDEIPSEEWVILRVFMFKVARTTKYPMCPEDGCYARIQDSECKEHGWIAEPKEGRRQIYLAGDSTGETYIIVPAKYALNGYNFEKRWCDIKGIWNSVLEGFYANLILPVGEEDSARTTRPIEQSPPKIETPTPSLKEEASPVDANLAADLKHFQQIIPFVNGYFVSQFDEFLKSNHIETPIEKLVELTSGCSIVGEGDARKVIYIKPAA